jgi:hypothetical protein
MLCSGARSAGTPNNRLQRAALRAAAERQNVGQIEQASKSRSIT